MTFTLIFSGPSGVGKSTLIKMLTDEFDCLYELCISHTTRKPRENEKKGVDYYFIKKDLFLKKIKNNEFIEYAYIHDNIYGTSKKSIENITKKKKICILDLDLQGVENILKNYKKELNPITIFISPPKIENLVDITVLEKRLRERGTEDEVSIKKRINNAKTELEKSKEINFNYTLVNDILEDTYKELKSLLLLDF